MNITKTGTFGEKDSVTLKKHNLTVEKKMFLFETGSLYIALAVLESWCRPGGPQIRRDLPVSAFQVYTTTSCGCPCTISRGKNLFKIFSVENNDKKFSVIK